jgi:acylphosphatase
MPTVHLLITGKVQGVFYRATAKKIATESGVTGWIKNTTNDAVECIATGDKESLQIFIDWCRKGPLNAVVKGVTIKPAADETFKAFSIVKG